VAEEEVVIRKRPVVREGPRIRKVAFEEDLVGTDVRKEGVGVMTKPGMASHRAGLGSVGEGSRSRAPEQSLGEAPR
jgi:stress response protein YsnF